MLIKKISIILEVILILETNKLLKQTNTAISCLKVQNKKILTLIIQIIMSQTKYKINLVI